MNLRILRLLPLNLAIAGCLIVAAGCSSAPKNDSETADQSTAKRVEDNEKMYRHLFDEVLNKGNLAALDSSLAPTYVYKAGTTEVHGLAEAKAYYAAFLKGFSKIEFVIDDIVGQDDKLAKRWTFSGTHTGEFGGIKPTGKRIKVVGTTFARIVDGKIVDELDFIDELGMLQQLGVIPPLGN